MNRLNRDQGNALVEEIDSLQRDVNEIRTRQSVPRALVIRTYISQTANTWDVNGYTVAANSTNYFRFFIVSDKSQPKPYGIQYSRVYNGATRLSDTQLLDASGVGYNWFNEAPSGSFDFVWGIAVSTRSNAATVYIKFRAQLSCPGVTLATSIS